MQSRSSKAIVRAAPARLSSSASHIGYLLGQKTVEEGFGVVRALIESRDRHRERKLIARVVTTQADLWNAEMERRHESFRAVVSLAEMLAASGRIDEALNVLSNATHMIPALTAPLAPPMTLALPEAR